MLKVNSINVFYGELQALWNVSLRIDEKEKVAILGSNGAGKTTTLRAILGVLPIKSGSIMFLDREIHRLPTHKIVELGIAIVPEGRRLFPRLTVLENLELGAYSRKAREKMRDTLEWIYQIFPILKERRNQIAGTLSGGEQQMLAIGRALMSKPKLLLMDEPTLGLAPKIALSVFEIVNKISNEGVTILLVEQNVRHTLEIVDRAYILEGGKIVMEGESNQLIDNEYVKKSYLGL
ncbi:MAG: ABC transporter ATP-binding protein [Candidatus Methanomethylicia archaeon]